MKLFIAVLLLLGVVSAGELENQQSDRFLFDDEPIVTTSQGKVKGQALGRSNDRVDRFLAIPYAEKPLGPLRFKPPVAHSGWGSELFDASSDLDPYIRDKTCMQLALTQRRTRGSEDCLYVNVWVNGGVEEARRNPLPVMVWIHGGAFMLGSSWGANFLDNWLYDLESMVRHGNVIGVSLNYRMGPLGFLSTGDDESPGNYGMLDQVEALKWVKNNIWAFGGDDSKITIFGESAGGASVSFHQISPLSQGLYHRAISQSGTALSPWAISKDPNRWAVEVAQYVNCTTVDSKSMMECLMSADAEQMNLAVKVLDLERDVLMDIPFTPVIDGYFLPDVPEKLVKNSVDRDYLIGHNDMDAHMFAGVPFPRLNVDRVPLFRSDLVKASKIWDYNVPKTVSDILVEQYEAKTRPVDDEFYKRAILNLFTDAHFAGPTHNMALMHKEEVLAAGSSANTFVYVFSHPSKMPKIYMPWMDADHADDLQYVFAKPLRNTRVYTDEEQSMSRAFMTYWTNFAWSGDPNTGPNGHTAPAYWKSYQVDTKHYLEINGTLSANGDLALQSDYRPEEFNFWRTDIPSAWKANGDLKKAD